MATFTKVAALDDVPEQAVQPAQGEGIRQGVRPVPVSDTEEGVVLRGKGDARLLQAAGEGIVAVEVELQAERG